MQFAGDNSGVEKRLDSLIQKVDDVCEQVKRLTDVMQNYVLQEPEPAPKPQRMAKR